MLPEVFRSNIRAINRTIDGKEWLPTASSMICAIKLFDSPIRRCWKQTKRADAFSQGAGGPE